MLYAVFHSHRQSRNENMVWISAAFSFADRIGDGLFFFFFAPVVYFYRFRTVFLYLGWLPVFFSCHLSRSC